MSTDTDRLSTQLSDLLVLKDGLLETGSALRDVIDAVAPVELETNAVGHKALARIAEEISEAYRELLAAANAMDADIAILAVKARQ